MPIIYYAILLGLFLVGPGCGNMFTVEINTPPVRGIECPDGLVAWQVPPETLPPDYPITFICVKK